MVLTRDARKRAAPEPPSRNGAGDVTNFQQTCGGANAVVASAAIASRTVATVDQGGFLSLKRFYPPKKKRKIRPKPLENQNKPPIEGLPVEVLENVLSFVDDPRKLLTLVSCIKVFRTAIVRRPDIVIKAAVYGNETTRQNLSSFFDHIRTGSIHIPTTLRLLRVINATRCEQGDQCLDYRLEKKVSREIGTYRPFGIALCHVCRGDLTLSMTKGKVHDLLDNQGLLNHELLCISGAEKAMLRRQMIERSTGHPIGSLIPSYKVTQVANTYFNFRPERMTLQEGMQSSERFFASLAKEAAERGRKAVLENALASELGKTMERERVEEMIELQDNSHRLQEMIEAYDEAEEGYKSFRKAKKDLSLARELSSYNREQKKRHRNKSKGGKKVISTIEKMVSSTKMGEQYQQKYTWLFDCKFDSKGCGRFEVPIVDEALGKVVRAPTTASDSKIAAAVDSLLNELEVLEASGFLGDWENDGIPFLDRDCPCENAIEKYCRAFIPNCGLLKRHWTSGRRNFLSLVKEDEPKQALYNAVHNGENRRGDEESDLFWIFTGCVALEYAEPDDEIWDTYLALAKLIWTPKNGHFSTQTWWNFDAFKAEYLRMRSKYRKLVEQIRVYLMLEETTAFLAEKGPPVHRPDQVFTRQDAIDSIWYLPEETEFLLTNGRFEDILLFHQRLFDNPRSHGLNPSKHLIPFH